MPKLGPPPGIVVKFNFIWKKWLSDVREYFGEPGVATPEKAIVLDKNGQLDEIDVTTFKLGGVEVTATAAELNYNDLGTGPGTAEASKTVVLDANKDITGIRYIDFGGQLKFPATQAASADANTLDDYEEGTFTGALICGTSGTISLYAAWSTGRYTKIGNLVTISGFFRAETISSPVGTLTLTGLPFAAKNSSDASAGFGIRTLTLAAAATTSITGILGQGASSIEISKFAAGANAALAGDVAVNSGFYINVSYFIG